MMNARTMPLWLTGGFRPFFFLGAVAMAASVAIWIPVYLGQWQVPTAFAPRDWHVHTMLFGGVLAIIAGFALTAVSNWTGRPPVAGLELLGLVVLWLAGRVAVSTSLLIGPVAAAAVDLLFPLALVAIFAREVIAGRNYRNLRVVALVALFGVIDLCFHVEVAVTGSADHALRGAVAIVVTIIMLIGGRIVPAFTRNWLAARRQVRLPAGFSRIDKITMIVSVAALIAWIVVPESSVTGGFLLVGGLLNAVRMARWCGLATRREPLLFVLHVAFATIPAGFAFLGAAIVSDGGLDPVAAVHVWTTGTVGLMTLAVMMRASRGHSGRALEAGWLEVAVYVLAGLGALARVLAPFAPGWMLPLFEMAALGWVAAYLLFAAGYFCMLFVRP